MKTTESPCSVQPGRHQRDVARQEKYPSFLEGQERTEPHIKEQGSHVSPEALLRPLEIPIDVNHALADGQVGRETEDGENNGQCRFSGSLGQNKSHRQDHDALRASHHTHTAIDINHFSPSTRVRDHN
jgi:hypothetical protein